MNEKIKTGKPTFPKNYGIPNEGMTLRDYFAAKAIQALIFSINTYELDDYKSVANDAYQIADAMLAERECGE